MSNFSIAEAPCEGVTVGPSCEGLVTVGDRSVESDTVTSKETPNEIVFVEISGSPQSASLKIPGDKGRRQDP